MSLPVGRIIGIYIGAHKGEGKRSTESAEMIPGHGLAGDSHAGRDPDRQISLFASEVLKRMQEEGFRLSDEDLSTNFLTEGLPLDSLRAGTRLRLGETVIELVEARRPCRSITKIDHRLPKRLYGECGQLARIIVGGVARVGDRIEVIDN